MAGRDAGAQRTDEVAHAAARLGVAAHRSRIALALPRRDLFALDGNDPAQDVAHGCDAASSSLVRATN